MCTAWHRGAASPPPPKRLSCSCSAHPAEWRRHPPSTPGREGSGSGPHLIQWLVENAPLSNLRHQMLEGRSQNMALHSKTQSLSEYFFTSSTSNHPRLSLPKTPSKPPHPTHHSSGLLGFWDVQSGCKDRHINRLRIGSHSFEGLRDSSC